jgi:DNA-directed RNA polymerase specialized sigma24 family protein
MNIPQEIANIFTKPGAERTPKEKERVIRWLGEDRQLKHLLHFALRYLGFPATAGDAEVVWADFCGMRLLKVIDSYDLAQRKESFWNYLLFPCFKNFCHDRRKQIKRRHEHEEPPPKPMGNEGEERIELEFPDENLNSDPLHVLEQEQEQLAARERIEKCLARLKSDYREVVEMF